MFKKIKIKGNNESIYNNKTKKYLNPNIYNLNIKNIHKKFTKNGLTYFVAINGLHVISVNSRNIEKVIIPEVIDGIKVISIDSFSFYHCENLIEAIIPDSVTNIGDYAFCNCINLKKIIIPRSVTSIGNNTFQNCEKLTDMSLSSSKIAIKKSILL